MDGYEYDNRTKSDKDITSNTGEPYQAYPIHTVARYICNSRYMLTGGGNRATCHEYHGWTRPNPAPECVRGEFYFHEVVINGTFRS